MILKSYPRGKRNKPLEGQLGDECSSRNDRYRGDCRGDLLQRHDASYRPDAPARRRSSIFVVTRTLSAPLPRRASEDPAVCENSQGTHVSEHVRPCDFSWTFGLRRRRLNRCALCQRELSERPTAHNPKPSEWVPTQLLACERSLPTTGKRDCPRRHVSKGPHRRQRHLPQMTTTSE